MNDRLVAIDVGRGLSVLFMIMVHTLWMYADQHTQTETWLGVLVHVIGKGTASFLVAMGISLMLSRNQNLQSALKRGIGLLTVAYFMNLLKFLLPIHLFGTMPQSFIAAYGWQLPLNVNQSLYLLLTGDILQMAGVAILVLAFVRYYITNKYHLLLLAGAVALSAKLFSGYRPGIPGLDYIADLFWGNQHNVYFPLLPWLTCILVGMYFGQLYKENKGNTTEFYRQMLRYGVAMLTIGGSLCWYDLGYHFADFFHLGAGGILYLTGLNLCGLWLIHQLINHVDLTAFYPFINYCSKRVTTLYIIQWVLICWGMGIVGFNQLNLNQTLLAMPVLIALTLLTQRLLDGITDFQKQHYRLLTQ